MRGNPSLSWLSTGSFHAILLTLLLQNPVPAQQSLLADEQFVSTFDVMTFESGDSSRTFVEVYCHVSTKWLQFVRTDSGFAARYMARLDIFDALASLQESKTFSDTMVVRTFWDIDAPRPAAAVRFVFLLAPGPYNFVLTIEDPETAQELSIKRDCEVQSYGSQAVAISTPVLAKSIRRTEITGTLVKFGHEIHPNVARTIGHETDSVFVYAEIYNPHKLTTQAEPSVTLVSVAILDRQGRVVTSRVRRLPDSQRDCNIVTCLNSHALAPGRYAIRVALIAPNGNSYMQKTTSFLVVGRDLTRDDYTELRNPRFGGPAFN